MSARDIYHNTVRTALEKEGWTITEDPLTLRFGGRQLMVDLGAERLLAAEKGDRRIAVEIKSFVGMSAIAEFYGALGQVLTYRSVLRRLQPDRVLYLAISLDIYTTFFAEMLPKVSIEDYDIKIIVFDSEQEAIVQWEP